VAKSNHPFVPSSPVPQGRIEGRYASSSDASFAPSDGPLSRHSLDTPPKAAATRDERSSDGPLSRHSLDTPPKAAATRDERSSDGPLSRHSLDTPPKAAA